MMGSILHLCSLAISILNPVMGELLREKGILYGQIGTDVTLFCRADNHRFIQWRVNGTRVALSNNTKVQNGNLKFLLTELASGGNYSCHDETGELLHWTRLELGHAPSKPRVHCRAFNVFRISCEWENHQDTTFPTRYIASYRDPQNQIQNCSADPLYKNICHIDNPQIFTSLPYVVNVTAVNTLGSRATLSEFLAMDIVQPNTPKNVRVKPVFGSPRRIKVRWDYPSLWDTRFELKFVLEYRPTIISFWSRLETALLKETITDAIPGELHLFRVKAKEVLDHGKWSDWSPEVTGTPWAETTTESIKPTTVIWLIEDTETEGQPSGPALSPTSVFTSPNVLDKYVFAVVSIAISIGISVVITILLLWIRRIKTEPDKKDILTKKPLTFC
ncbi:interleukin-11 receptor subunit alpha [Callorhinchus milii]|uniref:Interleukin 11 receptor, alpha n=1 Tax=Callorhinchus milii TaxID=7868 RepID=V9KET7_CALMI|nr:interleukin-11 receptor subunit alpha [Callorhinchus milii]|eukprot:gi/632969849/ref/XP_007901311.1/ PREDICTED: interleukin-11 receptor subunit alpha-like [Callorhinchus milii]